MTFDENQESVYHAALKTNGALRETSIILEDNKRKLDDASNTLKKLNEEFSRTADSIKNDFSKTLTEAIKGGDSFTATFLKVRKTLEDLAIKTAITNPITDIVFGGKTANLNAVSSVQDVLPERGSGGILGDVLNGFVSILGARAFGGPVGAGQPFLVGERGPELFVPQTAGRIHADAGTAPVSITMHISTPDAASFQRSQTQIAASMMDAARRAQRIR